MVTCLIFLTLVSTLNASPVTLDRTRRAITAKESTTDPSDSVTSFGSTMDPSDSVTSFASHLDYYDYDYLGDSDTEDTIDTFLSDLDPEFLRQLSPELILAYLENASPSDLEAILSSSTLLQSVSVETMAHVLKKLPDDLLIALGNSEGGKEFFTKTKLDISVEDMKKFNEIQNVLGSELVGKLSTEVILALPDYLLTSQLNNVEALKAVLKHPEKLQTLVENKPHLLSQISSKVSEVTFRAVISSLPEELMLKLSNNKVLVKNLPSSFLTTALQTLPKHLLQRLAVHSNILSYLSNSSFAVLLDQPEAKDLIGSLFPSELASIISQNPRLLEMEQSSSKLLSFISTENIIHLASREHILDLLPINIINQIFNDRPEIVKEIPAKVALDLVRIKPEAIEKIPLQNLKSLLLRTDILSSLGESDASSLVMSLSVEQVKFLGQDEIIMLNIPHRFIVNAATIRPQLISRIRPTILLSLAQSRFILENSPKEVLVAAVRQMSDPDILLLIENNAHLLSRIPVTSIEALLEEPRVSNLISTLEAAHLSSIIKHNPDMFAASIYTRILPHISTQALVHLSLLLSSLDDSLALLPTHLFVHLFTHRPHLIQAIPSTVAVKLLRSKQDIIAQLPSRTLHDLARTRSDVILRLNDDDLSSLVRMKPELILTAASLPTDSLVAFLDNNIHLITSLPEASYKYLTFLTRSKAFVARIPTRLYATFAEVGASVVDRIVDKAALLHILALHPNLPAIVNPNKVTKRLLSFLEDSTFIERLSCASIVSATRAPELLSLVSDKALDKLASSPRVLKCVPGDILEDLLESAEIQSRLGISTMLRGARNLPLRKMSLSLAYSFVSNQVTQTHNMFKDPLS